MAAHQTWWLAGIGLTWSFHLTFTLYMLSQRQPDVQEHGRIFSYVVIYMMNILLIGVWMTIVGSPHFSDFGIALKEQITSAYLWIWEWVHMGINHFSSTPQTPATIR